MTNQNDGLSKSARRDAARERALKIQREQERREQRSRMIILLGVIAGVVVVALLAFFILRQEKQPIDPTVTSFPSDVEVPASSDASGGFTFFAGKTTSTTPTDVPVLDLYLDFMCSHCADFEALNSEWLVEKANTGEFAYRIHPIAILGSQHSVTIGSAFVALLDSNPEAAMKFAQTAFAQQNASGMSQTAMKEAMKAAGATGEQISEAVSGKYERFMQAASNITLNNEKLRDADGNFGTPALFLNGERWDINWTDVEGFKAGLDEAIAAG